MNSNQQFTPPETTIRAKGNWSAFNIGEILEYKDMLRYLVIRDFISKYKQTILGPIWFILQPLLMGVIFTIIFGKVAGLSTDGTPQLLFYLCGQLGWTYFQACLTATAGNLITNANLFKKVYFPRVIVPLATITSNLLAFSIQLLSFLGFWLYFKFATDQGARFEMEISILLLPLLIIHTAAISLGTGLWLSALSAKYRDLHHLTPFFVQAFMYITPIIYPLSQVPERFHWLIKLNPLTAVVESYRHMLLGTPAIPTADLILSIAITSVVLISGLVIYERTQRNFIDYA
ncbi:ABC transporter permease [Coraliomargarita algicola]|uniref:Transport permease protein n=1 Tax=Coraliomargarita algicola TaxID=3092156 RepID=A0ABZ0RND9_9BACT|nr:ABC transporter permease [Coraliomargarita sp. J2-16]WPJ97736.1 ABC transporter permease [Coraliomargarita sp. J2-16]